MADGFDLVLWSVMKIEVKGRDLFQAPKGGTSYWRILDLSR